MKRMIKYILGLTLIVVASISCVRQTIYDPELFTAKIPVVINWSESLVDESKINNVSVYFYPEDGAAPVMAYSSDPYFVTAKLREGKYNIVLHNEIEGNILGVDCANSERLDGYTMSIQHDDASKYEMFYEPNAGEQLIKESEAIGVWSYETFEVTRDMIEYTRTRAFDELVTKLRSRSESRSAQTTTVEEGVDTRALVADLTKSLSLAFSDLDPATRSITRSLEDLNGVKPQPRTATYKVLMNIQNMNNIQYIEGVIDGFVDGAKVKSGDKVAAVANNYTFMKMSDHTFNEGSTTDGSMTYSFSNFGHLQNVSGERYTLTVNVIIHTGEKITKTVDITDQVNSQSINSVFEIKIGDDYNNGTTDLVLPENREAGFGVDGWEDAEDVIL